MMRKLLMAILVLSTSHILGCATRPYSFLGVPEDKASDTGPVGLINGNSCQVNSVTPVVERSFQEYNTAKQEDRIFTEETHGCYVYYAIKEQRDVRFDNASAWVEVIERFKAKRP